MKNFNYNCVLLIVIYLAFLVDKSIAVPSNRNVSEKQCVAVEGKCKNASDCCSKECLLFSCSDGGTSSSGYMSSTQDANIVTPDDVDYEIEVVTSAILPSTGKLYNSSQCYTADSPCTDSSQCCSNRCRSALMGFFQGGMCEAVILPVSGPIYNSSQCFDGFQNCTDSGQCCSRECMDLGIILGYMCTIHDTGSFCKIDGGKCKANWECCTKRCDAIHKKCVKQ